MKQAAFDKRCLVRDRKSQKSLSVDLSIALTSLPVVKLSFSSLEVPPLHDYESLCLRGRCSGNVCVRVWYMRYVQSTEYVDLLRHMCMG